MNPFTSACKYLLPALLLLTAAARGSTVIDKLPMDGYAAVVNKRVITIGDVMLATYEAQERLRLRYSGETLEQRREDLFFSGLEGLIERALILEEFASKEGFIPARAIDDQVNTVIHERFNGDKSALLQALAGDGVTIEEWRETIREQIIIGAMRRNEIGIRVVVSPKQVVDAYRDAEDRYRQPEKLKLRLIFISAGTDQEAAFAKIQEAQKAIADGQSFESVARRVSEDATAPTGGDWGWIESGDLREELQNAVTNLPVMQASAPVFTPSGYYLLRIDEIQEAATRGLDEVRDEIENELREKEFARLYEEWMQRLRQKHSVLYYIPRPDSSPSP